jgi:predicted ferric reductase
VVLAALADGKLWWYVSRSSGVVAWAVCTASVLWGLALSTRLIRRRGAPAWLLDLHRFLGVLSIVFTLVHMVSLWVHATWEFKEFPFGPAELLVPFQSEYAPGAVAWGIVAFYLLVAVQVSSWLMRRIKRRVWHAIHLSSFLLFAFATIHTFTAGTDRNNRLVQLLALVGVVMVVALTVVRVVSPRRSRPSARAASAASGASLPPPDPVTVAG